MVDQFIALLCAYFKMTIYIYIIITRSTYTYHASRQIYGKNSMNNHVILKGVDVEVMKVIQLASEVHN